MSPTPMHQSSGSSPQPSPMAARDMRQLHGPAAYLPSYFFSQWEICSMSADWFSVSMAFSTGMTCMPMPAPPGGTMAVMCSSGKNVIRSKKAVTSGWSAICCLFMLKNSALPGTNIGRMYCFSRRGFSQLYSSSPTTAICCKSGSRVSTGWPVALTSSGRVMGLRTFIFKATSAISSVTMDARPQYSGSSFVRMPFLAGMRSVIIWPSLAIFSRYGSSLGISKGSLLSSSGNAVGLLMVCSFLCRCSVFYVCCGGRRCREG